ncbi:phosphoribosylformylglycinamidine synthase subunit I [Cohaesibacter marisflavi]|uniref:Phosphoribosylformylglycinamidine synthase subunit PurQ n=1 Tax=Cohaesibacter marisflavi TaxID=655353 RepID=A0A1I5J459_9HYPH|nr:phosphoribosylformylglycinamidine synthase subunit PurQ [Cohaesibacter marisflavi]SFO67161.1 phosphoribosylformylglycinamidine synthase subunit I [Cohaesibacter marisflavi]
MKTAILVFPGTNREHDMAAAVRSVSGKDPMMVWHAETEIPEADLIILPGGFSYGDYLRSGAIAARSPIVADLLEKAKQGVRILGVCNGFQILTETGILPGALMRNAGLTFICKETKLRVERDDTIFTSSYKKGQVMRCPVAHHDGNFFADDDTLKMLEDEGRVLFRYCDAAGEASAEANINGSRNNIAGIMNARGTILGMMPHPENLIEDLHGGLDGRGLFESLLEKVA